MRLLYRLSIPSQPFIDVVIESSPDATIGDLADELRRYVDDPPSAAVTIAAEDDPTVPGREELVAAAAPRSGSVVGLVPATSVVRPEPVDAPVVLSPAAGGRPVHLPYGRSTVGSAPTCAVVVEAPGVAPIHADVVVGDGVEVHAVGTQAVDVDGTPVRGGMRLGSGSLISVGSALLTLRIDQPLRAPPPRGPFRPVARVPSMGQGPGVDPVEVPVPPERTRLPGFPVLSATVPLMMGAALWVATRNVLTAAFVLFSFVFVVAGGLESRRESRAERRFRTAEFRRRLADAAAQANDRADRSLAEMHTASPGPTELLGWTGGAADRLWERWDVGPAVMRVRLGCREQRLVPNAGRSGGLPHLREEADRIMAAAASRVAPVTIDLEHVRTLALTGSDEVAAAMGRSIVTQIAMLLGPDVCGIDVRAGPDRRPTWRWVEWLPHVESTPGRRRRLIVVDGLTGSALDEVLADLESDPGACAVIIATSPALLPRLGAVVAIAPHDPAGPPIARLRIGDGRWTDFEREDVSADEAETAARALAALRPSVPIGSSANPSLPHRLALSEVLDTGLEEDGATTIATRWRANRSSTSLAAPVGVAMGGVLSIDLRRDGPHALIAGTTGSGKSELLRTMLVALAAHHAAEQVTFLLVDYKGGAAFRSVSDLPHTVGLVTDLTPSLAERALVSLRAELRRRERLLVEAGATGATGIGALAAIDRPPALVVVVDEFATLAREIPAFVDGLVDVAQRGRSLGIHLVLATQRPAGVVTDAIRANTGLRISLRVADADDSRDVVDSPVAAHLPRDIPGRSVLRVGPHHVVSFQAAYSGEPVSRGPLVHIARLGETAPTTTVGTNPTGETELAALVEAVRRAHRALGGDLPRRPWLDPLPDRVAWSALDAAPSTDRAAVVAGQGRGPGAAGGMLVAIGLADRPDEQYQGPFHVDLGLGVLVVGAARCGRTTTLRTIANAAAVGFGPDIEIHAIDGGRDLDPLVGIDRVGDVVRIDDVERVTRLLRGLDTDLRRRLTDGIDSPSHRLLIIDGIGAVEEATASVNGGEALDLLARLATEGRAVNITVVASAGRRSEVPPAIYSALGQRIVLRCGTVDDAVMVGVPNDVAERPTRPGLAWCSGVVVQIATTDIDAPTSATRGAARSVDLPARVPRLPTVVRRSALDVGRGTSRWRLPIGVHGDDLATVDLDLTHHAALIAGPPRSGRSAALTTIADAARANGVARRILVSAWHSPWSDHPVWTHRWCLDRSDEPAGPEATDDAGAVIGTGSFTDLDTDDRTDDLIVGLGRVIDAVAASDDPTLVAFDDIVDLLELAAASSRLDAVVLRLLDLGRSRAVRVVVASETDALGRCYEDSVRRLRSGRTGILLVPDRDGGGSLLHMSLPRRDDLPPAPGRGWLLHPGSVAPVHLALADDPTSANHPT